MKRLHYITRLRAFVCCFPIDRVATIFITNDHASPSALTDAMSHDDKQVWHPPPKLAKSETEQKRFYGMVEHPIFNKFFEELKHCSLNDELTAHAFYEPEVAFEKRLWNFRSANEFGEKTPRPFTEVEVRRKEFLDFCRTAGATSSAARARRSAARRTCAGRGA